MAISTIQNASFGSDSIVNANGIKFPATQVPSADANTLDDYEEGTWTPVIIGSGGNPTITYTNQDGVYTKIGNTVFVVGYLQAGNRTGGGGDAYISGLPFLVSSSNKGDGQAIYYAVNSGIGTAAISAGPQTGSTSATLLASNNSGGNWSNTLISGIPNSLWAIKFSISYQVA